MTTAFGDTFLLSPLLSNLYLDPLDHHMDHKGYEMVRYVIPQRGLRRAGGDDG